MRGLAMVLTLVGLFAACASPTERWTFERAGTPDAQVKRDANECLARSFDATDANRPGLVRVDRATYRACMEQRGYTVRTTTE